MDENVKTEKTKKKVNIKGIIGYTIIFIVAVLLCFVLISNLSGQIAFIFNKAIVWVMTPSMEPEIPQKSYIVVTKIDAKDVKVGDVIIFLSDDPSIKDSYNTHRVVEIVGDNEEFVTKGDNNVAQDQYTAKADRVVGKYERCLPFLSKIGRFMFSSLGFVITLTLVLAIMMAIYLPDMMRSSKETINELKQKRQEQIDELVRQEVERLKREDAQKKEQDNLSNKEE